MQAQGFDPAPLALLKFNPDQPRVPAGSGRESGEWTTGDANITPVAFHGRRGKGRTGRGNRFDWIDRFLELFREPRKEPALEEKRRDPEVVKPEASLFVRQHRSREFQPQKPSDFVGQDFGKLGVGIEKPDLDIQEINTHAIERMAERGVSLDGLQDTVDHPLIVLQQSRGRVYFLTDKAAVVLNAKGRVITTYSASAFDTKIKTLLDHVHK